MTRLVFVDVDDTLLTPPYEAVRKVATFFGKKFPEQEAFFNRSSIEYNKAFPELFKSSAEMWAIALLSLPFGHFRSQGSMPFDAESISKLLTDHRLYLISKNPPSFTRWRVQRLRQLFSVRMGDRYIACGPILKRGQSKVAIMTQIARDRGVEFKDCLLIDDGVENLREVASAGGLCALVKSSWNVKDTEALQKLCPNLNVIDSYNIPEMIASHLGTPVEADTLPHFVVPPLTFQVITKLIWVFIKRWWLFSESLPKFKQIIPIARNPTLSYLFRDPHRTVRHRIKSLLCEPELIASLRILPLSGDNKPILLPVHLRAQLKEMNEDGKVRYFRAICKELMGSRGHRFVRDAKFFFTELNLAAEKHRILTSENINRAKTSYIKSHGKSVQEVDALTVSYVDELLTSRGYINCVFGEWLSDGMLARILKKVHLQTHPLVRQLEADHFLLYASTHRSILDSAVLWSIISKSGQSIPFAVGADKMRKHWIGRLSSRAGTFFLRRKFIDNIYMTVIAEHVSSMQKPGSSLEIFLEGQRSRSGLTLPPKKGIASVVWDNMKPHSKVAVVPVSFAYNKIPESDNLVHEVYEEKKKAGTLTLLEISDMKIEKARGKSTFQRMRALWRRLRAPLLSEGYVHFAEPIVLNKTNSQTGLQECLNETMLRINSATAILPSSVLCLLTLASEENHTTFENATEFLRFSEAMVGLYTLPNHLKSIFASADAKADVRSFIELPFVNLKFKRAHIREDNIICINDLDKDRASYYKNNILHFYVLPAILSFVFTDLRDGHIEELHRCFDHIFVKLQKTYFLPKVASARQFINSFLQILQERGLMDIADQRWIVKEHKDSIFILRALSHLGDELIQGDLPNILEAIRRSSARKTVHVPSRLMSTEKTVQAEARVTDMSSTGFYIQCEAGGHAGDHVEFTCKLSQTALSGVIDRVDVDGVAVLHGEIGTAEGSLPGRSPSTDAIAGSATFKREKQGFGVIKNLSPDGAFVATTLALAVGQSLTCSLGQHDSAHILHGRVARVTQTGVGVSFEHLSEESRALIVLASIDRTGSADGGRLS